MKLTGLGDATTTVVGATEILKRQEGMVTVTKVETSLSERGQARLMVVVTKGPKFDELDVDPANKEGKEDEEDAPKEDAPKEEAAAVDGAEA